MDMDRLDIAQLTSDKKIISAHNHLLNCAWEIVDFRCKDGIYSISFKKEFDTLEIAGTIGELYFRMNDEEVQELTDNNLIRTILF